MSEPTQRIHEINSRKDAAQELLLKCDRTNFGCQVPQAVKLIDDDLPWLIEQLETYQLEQEKRASNPGEVSDGYHTFNELYHHRAVLFSVICNEHPELAWKSLHHHTGGRPMYEGMFIVGINTPIGQATYHYDVDPYWGMFDVPVLKNAPEWDGHTPAQAIERIASLARERKNPKPLTCDGCGFQGPPHSARCAACCRSNEDRYEPKGEAICQSNG